MKTIITITSLLAGLLIIVYGYQFIFKKPILESPTINDEATFPAQKIELKEQYKGSTYTFVGTLELPTPCHTLEQSVNKISDTEYQIEINTIDPKKDIVCAQVITPKSYKVSFEAGADIDVSIRINGVVYQTNRFIVPSDVNIDSYTLDIKG